MTFGQVAWRMVGYLLTIGAPGVKNEIIQKCVSLLTQWSPDWYYNHFPKNLGKLILGKTFCISFWQQDFSTGIFLRISEKTNFTDHLKKAASALLIFQVSSWVSMGCFGLPFLSYCRKIAHLTTYTTLK